MWMKGHHLTLYSCSLHSQMVSVDQWLVPHSRAYLGTDAQHMGGGTDGGRGHGTWVAQMVGEGMVHGWHRWWERAWCMSGATEGGITWQGDTQLTLGADTQHGGGATEGGGAAEGGGLGEDPREDTKGEGGAGGKGRKERCVRKHGANIQDIFAHVWPTPDHDPKKFMLSACVMWNFNHGNSHTRELLLVSENLKLFCLSPISQSPASLTLDPACISPRATPPTCMYQPQGNPIPSLMCSTELTHPPLHHPHAVYQPPSIILSPHSPTSVPPPTCCVSAPKRRERREPESKSKSPSGKRGVNSSQEARIAWWRVKEYREKTENVP
ncbi:hypothetical protein EDC04DRAFT_2607185 [Pisolithus marmoratus]|nr:hypothetical protein EDC04DRAFT_2607185 [Pisolithus marmoratus]